MGGNPRKHLGKHIAPVAQAACQTEHLLFRDLSEKLFQGMQGAVIVRMIGWEDDASIPVDLSVGGTVSIKPDGIRRAILRNDLGQAIQ